MNLHLPADERLWTGRTSESQLYFYEKVQCVSLNEVLELEPSNVILGYAVDEGVRRNQGRVGAVAGPDAVRKMMASISNHLPNEDNVYDIGNVMCHDTDLEASHDVVSETVTKLLSKGHLPVLIGGGHDLAYAHHRGIASAFKNKKIGIINLDAHFDLRKVIDQRNSGTPFYQIAQECNDFHYLCLGIQKAANNRELYEVAARYAVTYIEAENFTSNQFDAIERVLETFISKVDVVYLTIDLDGFSSGIAPGVSAPSPMGFSVDVALKTIDMIIASNKLVSMDMVELNPRYDLDNSTARLAARLGYYVMLNSY